MDTDRLYELSELADDILKEKTSTTDIKPIISELKELISEIKDGSIGLAQLNPIVGDLEYKTKKIMKYISYATEIGLDLVIFPELSIMGYPIEDTIDRHPIIVDENNVILAGHTRLKSLLSQKWGGDLDVLRVSDLTEEQKKKFRILDNKTNEFAEWDFSKLEEELEDLDFGDFDFDFGTAMDDQEDETPIEEDETPEVENDFCKAGDLWLLGNHRLICGDSTDVEVIDRIMDGAKAKLLLTDPPYGIKADKGFSGAGGFSGKGKPIERRHYSDEWDTESPGKEVFDYICLKAEKAIIFGGNFFTDKLPVGNHWLVWNKHNTMPTFSDAELAWTNIKRNSVKLYDVEWNGLIGKEKERFHPTQKPVKLLADILNDYTEKGNSVCDFFGGSGSTLIACEQLNRKCFMVELDPHYCSVIVKRYVNIKGDSQNVYLIRGGNRLEYADVFND